MTNTDHLTIDNPQATTLTTPEAPAAALIPAAAGDVAPTPERKYNMLAVIAIVVTSINPIIGIVLGHIGYAQIKKTQERGKTLAITGYLALTLAATVLYITFILVMIAFSWTVGTVEYGYCDWDAGYNAGYQDGYSRRRERPLNRPEEPPGVWESNQRSPSPCNIWPAPSRLPRPITKGLPACRTCSTHPRSPTPTATAPACSPGATLGSSGRSLSTSTQRSGPRLPRTVEATHSSRLQDASWRRTPFHTAHQPSQTAWRIPGPFLRSLRPARPAAPPPSLSRVEASEPMALPLSSWTPVKPC